MILNNPDGLGFTQALKFYTFAPGFASAYVDWKREQQAVPEEYTAMCDVWSAGDSENLLPEHLPVSLEKKERLSEITNALNTVVYRYTTRFITGEMAFSEYGRYLEELESCGLNEAVEIYQEALMKDISN